MGVGTLTRGINEVNCKFPFADFLGSIVVSISACHAEDPGSIPGRGVLFFFFPLKYSVMLLIFFFFLFTFAHFEIFVSVKHKSSSKHFFFVV